MTDKCNGRQNIKQI